MRVIALGALATAAACAGNPRRSTAPAAPLASAEELAELEGEEVVSVGLSGQRAVSAGPLLTRLASRPGELLDRDKVADDLRRLWSAAAFADVAALVRRSQGGVALTFAVVERPLIRAARFEGDRPPFGARRIPGLAGGLYEPARLRRMAERLRSSYLRAGHRKAAVWFRARPAPGGRVDVTFHASAGPRYLVDAIDFTGQSVLDAARLRAELDTHDGAVNTAGTPYRDDLLAEDLARIQFLYYDLGMIDSRLGPPEVAVDERTHRLRVLVPVHEGAVYRLGRVALSARLARRRRRVLAALGVHRGETFSRARLAAGMARVQELVRALDRVDVSVYPETAIDAERHTVHITLAIDGEAER